LYHQLRFNPARPIGQRKPRIVSEILPLNRLLASLSAVDAAQLQGAFRTVVMEQGQVLNRPGDEVDHIYFPHAGMISLLALMQDGKAVETATVGREGGVGTMAGLGTHITLTQAVVQVPLIASQIHATPFRVAVRESAALRHLIVRYNDVLLGQVQVTAACNALHPIQARLARWILQTRERVDDDIVPLTHELLSEMLGVRRTSVTEAARKFHAAGLISYRRGSIEILNRRALEASACECFDTLRQQAHRLQYLSGNGNPW
jgi:CRP-like cAMP-binding protein